MVERIPTTGATHNTLTQVYLGEDNSTPLLATCITFLIIEGLFIFMMYASRLLGKDQKANLWMTFLMTGAYIVCIAKIAIGILLVQVGGAGRHMAALSSETISNGLKLQTALQIVCPLTTSLTKLGICILFLQIFGRTSKTYRIVIKATFAIVLCVMIIQVIIPFANCKPFSKTWNPQPTYDGKCAFTGLSLWRYLSIPNVLTTILMIAIPVPALYHLKVSIETKLGLGIIFSVCILGMTAAIMRFQAFLAVTDFSDIMYEVVTPLCWTIAESGIYLVAGVMPTLRPLTRKLFGNVKLDRLLSGSFGSGRFRVTSGSWGNKKGKLGMFSGKPLPPTPEKESFARGSLESTIVDVNGSGRSSRSEARETMFSVQEQSVIIMMER